MDSSKIPQDVNSSYTSDGAERSNLMTRDEFIKRVLHSGEVTRVAQHLALVIFLVAEGKNQLSLSIHDLEKITGWGRTAIKEHLDELDIFMRITFGGGRAKTLFELQGVVQEALEAAVTAAARLPEPTDPTASRPPDHVTTQHPTASRPSLLPVVAGWRPPPALAGREVAASLAAAVAASLATTSVTAAPRPPETSNLSVVAASRPPEGRLATPSEVEGAASRPPEDRQTAANPVVAASRPPGGRETAPPALIERERESNNNLSLSNTSRASEKAAEEPVHLNGVAIEGPGFKIAYAAIDMAAELIGLSRDRARKIAEVCAHDWAANGVKPSSPMAMVKRAMKNDFNEGQVQEVKLEKAKADAKPKESRAERMLRHVEAKSEKERR